ncbi:MAG: hypothetical protein KA774_07045 [Burkholderiaceae bacterium]|jgi:transcriptional regulator of acetoin/glycerol metabolism|nr:hypothetical protein [Burkholderiaceae bacterium]
MTSTSELQARLQTVRGHYRVSPWIQPRDDEAPLLRSWQRCHDAGMREHERVSFELVSRAQLSALDDAHGDLVRAARPETERLAQALRGTGSAVLMFNARGVVIDRLCHEAAAPAPLLQATRKGVNLAERCVGTSAPAIALAEGLPYLVGRDAHFFDNVRPFFCVAAPIDSPDGRRLGALDITTYDQVPGFDVFSLVMDTAAGIENGLFTPTPDHLVVHFHPRAELLGTPMEGLLLVDTGGRVTGANRMAARLLCMPRTALLGQAFGGLFDRRLQGLFAQPSRQRADLVEMQTHVGLQVMARFEGEAARDGMHQLLGQGMHPPVPVDDAADAPTPLRALECQAIERTLAALGGNVSATAKALGISRNTIYRRRQEATGKAG